MKNSGTYHTPTRGLRFASFMEAVKMNSPFAADGKDFREITGREIGIPGIISCNAAGMGGIIVFPVSARDIIGGNGPGEDLRAILENAWTALNSPSGGDDTTPPLPGFGNLPAFSTGPFFRGRYLDRRNGTLFDRRSLSVEIIGVPGDRLPRLASLAARALGKRGALVRDSESGRMYLVDAAPDTNRKAG